MEIFSTFSTIFPFLSEIFLGKVGNICRKFFLTILCFRKMLTLKCQLHLRNSSALSNRGQQTTARKWPALYSSPAQPCAQRVAFLLLSARGGRPTAARRSPSPGQLSKSLLIDSKGWSLLQTDDRPPALTGPKEVRVGEPPPPRGVPPVPPPRPALRVAYGPRSRAGAPPRARLGPRRRTPIRSAGLARPMPAAIATDKTHSRGRLKMQPPPRRDARTQGARFNARLGVECQPWHKPRRYRAANQRVRLPRGRPFTAEASGG